MRVGIDIDDTICNTRSIMILFLSKYYNLDYKKVKDKDYAYFENFKDYFDVVKECADDLVSTAKLKYGVLKYLKKIKKRGHKIIFITNRYYKEFKEPYEVSLKYLKDNKIPFDKLIICNADKGNICLEENIDIFFDDSINNYKSVENVGIDTYLMYDTPNKMIKNVKRVYSLRDIYLKVKRKEKTYGGKNTI